MKMKLSPGVGIALGIGAIVILYMVMKNKQASASAVPAPVTPQFVPVDLSLISPISNAGITLDVQPPGAIPMTLTFN